MPAKEISKAALRELLESEASTLSDYSIGFVLLTAALAPWIAFQSTVSTSGQRTDRSSGIATGATARHLARARPSSRRRRCAF